jgi:hypothetical protein
MLQMSSSQQRLATATDSSASLSAQFKELKKLVTSGVNFT